MFGFWRRKAREKDKGQEITQPQDKPGFSALEISPSDPLASEHQLITRWISAAFASLDPKYPYFDVELKKLKEGQAILDASPEQARRLVMAGVAQVLHWEMDVERIRSHGKNDMERQNPQDIP